MDLNVLVDYGWPSFLDNAAAVVEAVPHASVLGDLLAALREHSVTAAGGLYASMPAYKPAQVCLPMSGLNARQTHVSGPYDRVEQLLREPRSGAMQGLPAAVQKENKIAAVCSVLRQAMEAVGQRRFLSAILMSYAKEGDLTGALSLIKQLKEERLASSSQQESAQQVPPFASQPDEAAGSAAAGHSPAEEEPLRHDGGVTGSVEKQWSAEEGMRYLLLYTEVEKLYKWVLAHMKQRQARISG